MAKMAKWRRHDKDFKRQVVERMKTCQNITELARELKVERKLLYIWKYQFAGRPEPRHADLTITAEERKVNQLRKENDRLKLALGEKVLENDFFRSALQKIEEKRRPRSGNGASASTRPSAHGCKSKAS